MGRKVTMTKEQLEEKYGKDIYLVVVGSRGNVPFHQMSEDDAIRAYEKVPEEDGDPAANAFAVVVCIPSPYGDPHYRHGWIRDGYEWDAMKLSDPSVPTVRKAGNGDDGKMSATLEVDGKDVVITDPCYLITDKLWQDLCGSKFTQARILPRNLRIGGVDMVLADTIYGDWMCKLVGAKGGDPKAEFGTFTADAGMVCATTLMRSDPWKALDRIPRRCWAVIPKFTGHVTIRHADGACKLYGEGVSDGTPVSFSSVQIG